MRRKRWYGSKLRWNPISIQLSDNLELRCGTWGQAEPRTRRKVVYRLFGKVEWKAWSLPESKWKKTLNEVVALCGENEFFFSRSDHLNLNTVSKTSSWSITAFIFKRTFFSQAPGLPIKSEVMTEIPLWAPMWTCYETPALFGLQLDKHSALSLSFHERTHKLKQITQENWSRKVLRHSWVTN